MLDHCASDGAPDSAFASMAQKRADALLIWPSVLLPDALTIWRS
jgi:hypothetical protein